MCLHTCAGMRVWHRGLAGGRRRHCNPPGPSCTPPAVCRAGRGGRGCSPCPRGSYSAGGNETHPDRPCVACPANATSLGEGGENATVCSGGSFAMLAVLKDDSPCTIWRLCIGVGQARVPAVVEHHDCISSHRTPPPAMRTPLTPPAPSMCHPSLPPRPRRAFVARRPRRRRLLRALRARDVLSRRQRNRARARVRAVPRRLHDAGRGLQLHGQLHRCGRVGAARLVARRAGRHVMWRANAGPRVAGASAACLRRGGPHLSSLPVNSLPFLPRSLRPRARRPRLRQVPARLLLGRRQRHRGGAQLHAVPSAADDGGRRRHQRHGLRR